MTQEEYLKLIPIIHDRLVNTYGWKDAAAVNAIAASMNETGRGTHISAPYNFAGISTSSPTPYPRPSNEGGYYQSFANVNDFTDQWVSQVWVNYGDEIKNAVDPIEFVRLMKEHGYFTGPEEDYAKNVSSISQEIIEEGLVNYNPIGKKIIEVAEKYYGKAYKEGATGPDAFGIGEYVYTVFKEAGHDVSEKTPDAIYKYVTTNKGESFEDDATALAGDLVFYKDTRKGVKTVDDNGVTQVAIFKSNDVVYECLEEKGVVKYALDYFKTAKRIYVRFGNTISVEETRKQKASQKKFGTSNPSDSGFRITPAGKDHVKIVKLPQGLTYCEPIYPDLVCVSDFVPAWVLHESLESSNANAEENKDSKDSKDTENTNTGEAKKQETK